MSSTEAARAEAFASQADRSRELTAGYLQQAIETTKAVRDMKVLIDRTLNSIAIQHRWSGTQLEILSPNGDWITGPDLRGLDGRYIVSAEIGEDGHLMVSLSDGEQIDAGEAARGDFLKALDTSDDITEGATHKFATVAEKAKLAHVSVTQAVDLDAVEALATSALQPSQIGLTAGKIPTLDGDGLLPVSALPALAITDTTEVASQSAMLALVAQKGDLAIRTDLNKCFILTASPATTLANWKELRTPTDLVLAVAGLTGTITAAALKTALAMTVADITDMSANGRLLVAMSTYANMFSAIKQTATTTATGVSELATNAEAQAKSDATRTLTPSNLAALGASETFAGLVELATAAETVAGTDTSLGTHPAGVAAAIAAAIAAAPSAVTLLTTQAVPSATSFQITSIPAGYRELYVMFDTVTGSTGNMRVAVSDDNGSTWGSNYDTGVSSGTGQVTIKNAGSAGLPKHMSKEGFGSTSYSAQNEATKTGVVNALSFTKASNSFSGGTIRLYGVR